MTSGEHARPAAPSRRGMLRGAGVLLGGAVLSGAGILGGCALRPPTLGERCRLGAFPAGTDLVKDFVALQETLGVPLPVLSWFKDWGDGWETGLTRRMAAISTPAPDLLIAWEAMRVPLAQIASGQRDRFIRSFLRGAASYPGRVVIRPFHEMNGDWYTWSVPHGDALVGSVDEWKLAWRRIVTVGRSVKAANVSFMFCVNCSDHGGVRLEDYWPGADVVDLLGIDGYNRGWNADGSPLLTPHALLDDAYARLTALHPTAAVWVGEIGCAAGEGKADWLSTLLGIREFERLTTLCFFNEDKEQDWRITDSPASREAVSQAVQD